MSQPSPRLQPLTAALLLALTPLEVTRAVVEHGVGILGAHGGLVALVVGEKLKLIEDRGYPLETLAPWLEVPLSASLPLSDVARSGTPFFRPSRWRQIDW